MHRIIWPYIGQEIGVNIGENKGQPFVPVVLKAADERVFTVSYQGAHMHFGTQWVVSTAEGKFQLADRAAVKLLIEVQRSAGDGHAASVIRSNS